MSYPIFKIVVVVVWIVAPLICMLLLQLPGWILGDDERPLPFLQKHLDLIVGLFVSLCWACALLAMLFSSPYFDLKHQNVRSLGLLAAAMLFFSWAAGACVGGLIFGLANCAADRSPGQEATIKDVKGEGRSISFRIDEPFSATFACAGWRHSRGKRFFVHPGRLGARWGEFR